MFKNFRVAAATMAILAGTAGAAAAADPVLPGECAFGMTAGDWSAAWWQYVLQIPAANNPAADTTGANCGVDQGAGPVFFLTGNFTSSASVTRNCTIPAGKTLLVPIINSECSTLEPAPFYAATEKELRSCAAAQIDTVDTGSLQLSVDGENIPNLDKYRVQSPVYSFHIPAKNIIALKTGAKNGLTGGAGSSVSDGYWVLLKPLPPRDSAYTIKIKGTIGSGPSAFTVDVTYNLTVQSPTKAAISGPKVAEGTALR